MIKRLFTDLLTAMTDMHSDPHLNWTVETRTRTVQIEAPTGVWVFTAPLGRQVTRYLLVGSNRHQQYLQYTDPLSFQDILLLTFIAEIVVLARKTTEDVSHLSALTEALNAFQLWLDGSHRRQADE